jgi:putative transposase
VLTNHGAVRIRSPRDRNATFEPQIVAKRQTRWVGFDEKVIALYASGLSVREIQAHLSEFYGSDVSADMISRITDAVLADVKAWQSRPLDSVYAVLYLDALVVKVRDGQAVRNHACYLAIGVNLDGERDVLGMWFQRTEGAKFWLQVLTELRQRGVQDVLVCCVDGLTGFPDAIEAVFPQTWVQTCIVHLVRSSLRFVPYKDRKRVAADLRKIYTAADQDAAADELAASRRSGMRASRRSAAPGLSAGSASRRSSRSRPTCGASSTRPTRSRRSTAKSGAPGIDVVEVKARKRS